MHTKKKRRNASEINAGSMADIAFLLLIFFLVTTTINAEKGIRVILPPYNPDIPPGIVIDRNVLNVKINLHDELLVEKQVMDLKDLKDTAVEFITNPSARDDLPRSPRSAIISIQNDRRTSYEAYIAAYNEIQAAYNQVWNFEAEKRFNLSYEDCSAGQKKLIKNDFPLVISEAEPFE